jgi:hypothetical protein
MMQTSSNKFKQSRSRRCSEFKQRLKISRSPNVVSAGNQGSSSVHLTYAGSKVLQTNQHIC